MQRLHPGLKHWGVRSRDYGLAIRPSTGASTCFSFLEAKKLDAICECSLRVYTDLFTHSRGSEESVCFLLFPSSSAGEPSGVPGDTAMHKKLEAEISKLSQAQNLSVLGSFFANHSTLNGMAKKERSDAGKITQFRAREAANVLRALEGYGLSKAT